MRKYLAWGAVAAAVTLSLFHLYTGYFGVLVALLQRSYHLLLAMVVAFLVFPASKKHADHPAVIALDAFCAAASVVCIGYIILNYDYIVNRIGLASPVSAGEFILGMGMFALILEALRRTTGWPLMIVTFCTLIYTWAGPYMPGIFAHRGWSWSHIVAYMYLDQEAIFGIPLGVSATYAALFILFGAFLTATGVGDFFNDVASALTGKSRGGPAKIAVVSSAMFGTVSGSPVGDVYASGAFTIPLMKSLGYKPHFAGAVEAAASTGGAIMPPVMGAIAFLMADITGIPYVQIALAAAIPGLLYYFSVGMMVHFEACRYDLKGLSPDRVPPLRQSLRDSHLLIPLVGLIAVLGVGYTTFRAAFISIVLAVAVSFIRARTRLTWKSGFAALEQGGRDMVLIATATAAAGIIAGSVALTGLGLRFTSLVLSFGKVSLILPLILTMIACLVLGMGVPGAVAYLIVATLAVPALVELGVPVLAAHLFAVYFAVMSNVTPPVAMAAYAGASIAEASMMRTGVTATKLALTGFIIPFMFVYGPPLLLKGEPLEVVWAILTATLGVVALAAGLEGWLRGRAGWFERAVLVGSALALIKPGIVTDAMGLAGFALVIARQWMKFGGRQPA
ncbi:MAG: TRAP transporter permease [Nitrospinota bacterium]